ncbi:predicted protein [Lodderomyces elongisporus NRRL YB-4239]|uniref:Uncharacterized protein n=1 Tax=Lodderomyces elongisporus (strain ATCC 11503 / CBS 2605 / JCM 1781 / NBRC 1676 / NRRL YB-4239) TaxID=379508 RepID=A5E1W1_LODEL|nr:predicted protein [Lodderomyces elongisporus NRRL YB-4239]
MFKSSPFWFFSKSSTRQKQPANDATPSHLQNPSRMTFTYQKDTQIVNVVMKETQPDAREDTNATTTSITSTTTNKQDDGFIEISSVPLSYAEVASIGANKKNPQSLLTTPTASASSSTPTISLKPPTTARPAKETLQINQYNVLAKDDNMPDDSNLDSSVIEENLKSEDDYNRSQHYKKQQFQFNMNKKKKAREMKNKQKC